MLLHLYKTFSSSSSFKSMSSHCVQLEPSRIAKTFIPTSFPLPWTAKRLEYNTTRFLHSLCPVKVLSKRGTKLSLTYCDSLPEGAEPNAVGLFGDCDMAAAQGMEQEPCRLRYQCEDMESDLRVSTARSVEHNWKWTSATCTAGTSGFICVAM